MTQFYAVATYIPNPILEILREESPETIQKYLLLQPSRNIQEKMNQRPHLSMMSLSILCIRIVSYRSISAEFYTSAIMEALTPRLEAIWASKKEEEQTDTSAFINSSEMDIDAYLIDLKEQFQALNNIDWEAGAVMEMTIERIENNSDDDVDYKMVLSGRGEIHSKEFCMALCMVYFEGQLGDVCASVAGGDDHNGDDIPSSIDKETLGECVSLGHRDNVIRGIKGMNEDESIRSNVDCSSWGLSSTLAQGYSTLREFMSL